MCDTCGCKGAEEFGAEDWRFYQEYETVIQF